MPQKRTGRAPAEPYTTGTHDEAERAAGRCARVPWKRTGRAPAADIAALEGTF
jgi:hypothetical protein